MKAKVISQWTDQENAYLAISVDETEMQHDGDKGLKPKQVVVEYIGIVSLDDLKFKKVEREDKNDEGNKIIVVDKVERSEDEQRQVMIEAVKKVRDAQWPETIAVPEITGVLTI